jgi:CheY-like chemotaxis protein
MAQLRRILLVDDDEDLRALVQLCLESLAGFEVMSLEEAPQALLALESFQPDLILLDVEMPGMDGLTAFSQIQQSGASPPPVIFLTARQSPGDITYYCALGALAVITKPFDPMALPQMLRALWQQKK